MTQTFYIEGATAGAPTSAVAGDGAVADVHTHPHSTSLPAGGQYPPATIWQLARLKAGQSYDCDLLVTAIPELSWDGTLEHDRRLVNDLLQGNPDLARAVLAMDPASSLEEARPSKSAHPSISDLDTPLLPDYAQPTTAMSRAADTTGEVLRLVMDYTTRRSPRTPAIFHQYGALFLGTIPIARRLKLVLPHNDVYPNLYGLNVAPTTLYAKTTGMNIIRDIAIDLFPHLLMPDEFTPESILEEMAGQKPAHIDDAPTEDRKLWERGRDFAAQRAIILDEASSLFAGLRRDYMAGGMELLLRFYDGPALYRRHTRGSGWFVIRNAALSFWGATTPEALANARIESGWYNGLFARFALLTPDSPPHYCQSDPNTQRPLEIGTVLTRLANSLLPKPVYPQVPTAQTVPITDDALAAYHRYDRAMTFDLLMNTNAPDKRLWGTYGRLPTQALKIALIVAALDWAAKPTQSLAVQLGHWTLAQNITEEWRASAHRLLVSLDSDRGEESTERRLLQIVDRGGATGLTARELGQLMHRRRETVERLLVQLVQDGLIETFIPSGGKVNRYRLSGVALEHRSAVANATVGGQE